MANPVNDLTSPPVPSHPKSSTATATTATAATTAVANTTATATASAILASAAAGVTSPASVCKTNDQVPIDVKNVADTVVTGQQSKANDNNNHNHNHSHKNLQSNRADNQPDSRDSSTEPESPSQVQTTVSQPRIPGLTPQYAAYPYMAYREPPSPAGMGSALYDASNFPGNFHSIGTVGSYGGDSTGGPAPAGNLVGIPSIPNVRQPPGSPSQNSTGIPPASPLFPRITSGASTQLLEHAIQAGMAPLSPGPPYLSPVFGPTSAGGIYMNAYARPPPQQHFQQPRHQQGIPQSDGAQDEYSNGWNDSQQRQSGMAGAQFSPQISGQGIPMPYVPGMPAAGGGRSSSFDEMLPGPVIAPDQKSQGTAATQQTMSTSETANSAYSPYGPSSLAAPAIAGMSGTSMFAHGGPNGQTWAYNSGVQDMYSPPSPLQPRPTSLHHYGAVSHMPRIHPHSNAGMPHQPPGGPYMANSYGAPYYPATSPGPPIQTSASNKGPDGANLFIFHIPNHFTNIDMYNLFVPYGNLLSVRIMVERETGRSRGFGFVSYDNPESAAIAIRELNQYPIGNKRLKVQHKMIKNDHGKSREHHNNGQHGGHNSSHPHNNYGDKSGNSGMGRDDVRNLTEGSNHPGGNQGGEWQNPATVAPVHSTEPVTSDGGGDGGPTDSAATESPERSEGENPSAKSSDTPTDPPKDQASPLDNMDSLGSALPKSG